MRCRSGWLLWSRSPACRALIGWLLRPLVPHVQGTPNAPRHRVMHPVQRNLQHVQPTCPARVPELCEGLPQQHSRQEGVEVCRSGGGEVAAAFAANGRAFRGASGTRAGEDADGCRSASHGGACSHLAVDELATSHARLPGWTTSHLRVLVWNWPWKTATNPFNGAVLPALVFG